MASTIKVDKIEGSTGSTVTIPTGQTLTVTDGIPVASGGTGLASFTTGDILYATGSTTLAKLGKELKTEDGYKAAERCALNIISQAKNACNNDLSKIKSCIKLTGFVNSTDNFIEQPKVINGASDIIYSVFGDIGKHTRVAVSANSLPLGVAVEVDAIFELN